MTRYIVNVTVTIPGWVEVEAHSPEEALAEAHQYSPAVFEVDDSSREIEFNVTPAVEEA